ncbi:hypothetical protein [Shigella phage ESh33]|nr:hypothetical protein [Shigella phage ESh33]
MIGSLRAPFFISKIFHKTVYKHKALWYYTTIKTNE